MLLIEHVTDMKTQRRLMMTHDTKGTGRTAEHIFRFYKPQPQLGAMAGELEFTVVLSAEQAAELKAHL